MDENPFRDHQVEALKRLTEVRGQLLPVIGAGLSVPLGAPDWQGLKTKVIERIFTKAEHGLYQSKEPQIVFADALRQDPTQYRSLLRQELAGLEGCTSLALQSVVRLPVTTFATTNLDHHVEASFSYTAKLLLPSRIGTSVDIPRLRAAKRSSQKPILVKLHGTLDIPQTWVMTEEEYFEKYKAGSDIHSFLSSGQYTPLFIGFSVNDYEVRKAMFNFAKTGSESFAFFRVDQAASLEIITKDMSRLGIRVVPIRRYDEIAELLELLFPQPPEQVFEAKSHQQSSRFVTLKVGAASATADDQLGDPDLGIVKSALVNALDYSPNRDLNGKTYRTSDPRDAYLFGLSSLLAKLKDHEVRAALGLFVGVVAHYPDFAIQRFVPDLIDHLKGGNSDLVWQALASVTDTYDGLSNRQQIPDSAANTIRELLVKQIVRLLPPREFSRYGYRTRRALLRFLGKSGAHPSCRLPPEVAPVRMESGDWSVMKHHLCRFQMGMLYEAIRSQTSANDLETRNPLRPYTISSFSQIQSIITALRKIDPGHQYTLLTSAEWQRLSTNGGETRWPWGDDMPEQGRHAALRFDKKRFLRDDKGNLVEGSTELGLFPGGVNRDGIHDLIGNVYDVVFTSEGARNDYEESLVTGKPVRIEDELLFSICGGAWYFTPSRARDYRVKSPYYNPRFGKNIGIRLAYRST
ncbi:SIR2 family protein [Bradyrhizobium sp. INPA03-11B]|uniref:SIR2 family protein n=1 Tax=Bradyrhizobium sp. INPA03-11B TaxID=418598 RepID=UPI00338D3B82